MQPSCRLSPSRSGRVEVLDRGFGHVAKGGEWELRGVVKGPRQADQPSTAHPRRHWATGDSSRVEGHGDTAEEAVQDLANQDAASVRTRTGESGIQAPAAACSLD